MDSYGCQSLLHSIQRPESGRDDVLGEVLEQARAGGLNGTRLLHSTLRIQAVELHAEAKGVGHGPGSPIDGRSSIESAMQQVPEQGRMAIARADPAASWDNPSAWKPIRSTTSRQDERGRFGPRSQRS